VARAARIFSVSSAPILNATLCSERIPFRDSANQPSSMSLFSRVPSNSRRVFAAVTWALRRPPWSAPRTASRKDSGRPLSRRANAIDGGAPAADSHARPTSRYHPDRTRSAADASKQSRSHNERTYCTFVDYMSSIAVHVRTRICPGHKEKGSKNVSIRAARPLKRRRLFGPGFARTDDRPRKDRGGFARRNP